MDIDLEHILKEFRAIVTDRGAQVIHIDASKHLAVMIICAAICTATLVLSIVAMISAYNSRTESRLVEYYLMDPNYRTQDELKLWSKFKEEHK